jgi:hypothetical protein
MALKPREPAKARESHARSLKTKYTKAGGRGGLKAFVRKLSDDESKIQAEDWLFNKRADFHKNQLCSGRTRTRVKRGGAVKGAPDKNLSGK